MTASDNNNNSNGKAPFWKPWGVWGFLWRTLLFLGSIVLICYLLNIFGDNFNKEKPSEKKEKGRKERTPLRDTLSGQETPPGWDTIAYPQDPYDSSANPGRPYHPIPPEIRDDRPVDDWGTPIHGVPELPDPRDNRIPPVNPNDSTRVVPNPYDTITRVVADQLIVFFNSNDLRNDMTSFARQFKQHYPSDAYQILYYNLEAGTMVLGVPEQKLLKVMEELPRKITDIDFRVTLNEILEEAFAPSDPGFRKVSYDEYFKLIQAYQAWDITKGSAEVKVAIVDSYFDLTNPEIGERYVDPIYIPTKSRNVLPPSTPPRSTDDLASYCHGSHVAGLAIGAQNNDMGCSGIAPECTWIPIALGNQLTQFNIIEATLYAIYHDADVVNLSLGRSYGVYSNAHPDDPSFIQVPVEDQVEIAKNANRRGEDLWEYIYKVANDHKCVIVAASGNDNFVTGMDPMKRFKNIVRVEAVDGKGLKADFSNYGIVEDEGLNYSTVAAPGVNLWSATPAACVPYWKSIERETHMKSSREGMLEMSGTSMASPVTAGAVALLKSKNKDLTAEEIINILRMTAKQTDPSNTIGPTIQIRDALDATSGGEQANFDDLMRDHSQLVGRWKSTQTIDINSHQTGEKIDEGWCYMTFTSPDTGTLEWRTVEGRNKYTAPLTVEWEQNVIRIIQNGYARSNTASDYLLDYIYYCTPNRNRMLEAVSIREGREEDHFMLEKVY